MVSSNRFNIYPFMVLVLFISLFMARICMTSYASETYTDIYKYEYDDIHSVHASLTESFVCKSKVYKYVSPFDVSGKNDDRECIYLSSSPFTYDFIRTFGSFSQSGVKTSTLLSNGLFSDVPFRFSLGGDGHVLNFKETASVIMVDPWVSDFWLAPDFVLGSGGAPVDPPSPTVSYDATIPVPQNLQFKASSLIANLTGNTYHQLTWTNSNVGSLFTRISAVVVAVDDQNNSVEKELPILTDTYPASTLFYKYDFKDFFDSVSTSVGMGKHMVSMALKQYRVQFYYVDKDGVTCVGPVGIIGVKRNILGIYDGHTVSVEIPKNVDDLGSSGGFLDSDSGGWSSEGQEYQEYDKNGNPDGSGTVGKDDNISGNGNPLATIQNIISALVNIPTLIANFFKSLSGMMSGIGALPSVLSSLFSFLPVELISMIGLGIAVVIMLRIFGR